jgi:Raf kinase inhibitor-like YbhB/YbcL family protein
MAECAPFASKVGMAFKLTSPAFADGADVPIRHTCDGENRSPHLVWDEPPADTRSLALIVDDPDAPGGTFTHWLLYDLPASLRELNEGASGTVGKEGRNSFGNIGYGGPCPPPGDPPHRYRFTLYALDVPTLKLSGNLTPKELESEISAHILDSTRLVGRYQRQQRTGARGR